MTGATRRPKLGPHEKGSRREPVWDPFEKAPGALSEGRISLTCPVCKQTLQGRAALLTHADAKHGRTGAPTALQRKISAAIHRQTTREASIEELVRSRMRQANANVAYSRSLGAGDAGETRQMEHPPVGLSGRLGNALKKKRA